MKGYVQLRRGILDHLPGMTGSEVKTYIAVLVQARFTPPRTGELVTSVRDLASDLKASRSEVSRSLRALADPHGAKGTRYIEYTPGVNQYAPTVVRVLNYAVPETVTPRVTAPGQHRDSTGTAPGQHDGDDLPEGDPKNVENVENERDTTPRGGETPANGHFDTFWAAYPLKVGKETARRKYAAALKKASPEVILAGLERVKPGWTTIERRFIPHPEKWLYRGGWEDEVTPPPATGPREYEPGTF